MSTTERKNWTRDELIIAINLYCKTPFGRIHIRNPEIQELANKLGRTPGSISYKLANFASLDPTLTQRGAENVSRLDKDVWNEFFQNWDSMFAESEVKTKELKGESEVFEDFPELKNLEGESKESIIKTRVNQALFRKMILSSYNEKCCITGIEHSELLVASHIIPWSQDSKNRLNPMNGLCLNSLHDRAFDKGFITINEDYKVVVSQKIRHELIAKFHTVKITLPDRLLPDQNFLSYHRKNIFRDS